MKRGIFIMALFTVFVFTTGRTEAQTNGGCRGGRGGGHGVAQEADGDGIPNCQDPDFIRPNIGTGRRGPGTTDADSNAVDDRLQDDDGDGVPNCQDPDSPLFNQGGFKQTMHRFMKRVNVRLKGMGYRFGWRFQPEQNGSGS
jgi:hypothetical protein